MQLLCGFIALSWLTTSSLIHFPSTPSSDSSRRPSLAVPSSVVARGPLAHRAARNELWDGRSDVDGLRVAVARRSRPQLRSRRRQFRELTRREQEIIRLLIQGVSNKEIAQHLSISERTVKGHLTHVYSKLGVSSRLQLAVSTLQTNTKVP
ncbi:MAG TPA: LuxR C-terminal-related transcriptional regulator [Methylomirabilota bacterium]|jgi:DNA-binding NarL/FixJ family response regulator